MAADSNNVSRLIVRDNGSIGLSTTTPTKTLEVSGDTLVGSAATTTLILDSTGGINSGGCLQIKNARGTGWFRAYVTSTGALAMEPGTCK